MGFCAESAFPGPQGTREQGAQLLPLPFRAGTGFLRHAGPYLPVSSHTREYLPKPDLNEDTERYFTKSL